MFWRILLGKKQFYVCLEESKIKKKKINEITKRPGKIERKKLLHPNRIQHKLLFDTYIYLQLE